MNKKGKKSKKKKKLGQLFIRGMVFTLIALVVLVAGFAFVYNHFMYGGSSSPGKATKDPINKTLAVFGVDEDGYRTDVIFVLNYNSETGKTRVISVPRDTKVQWSDVQRARMEEIKDYSISVSKINEMTSYAGIENITDFTINEVERLLDIEIDNYVIISIDSFKQIVDDIGGVDVEVPALNGDGLHYDDNSQDLHIHLEPGLQHLDGEAAEGLVRYRKGYAEGDVGRIRTQQLFLEAFAKKVTSPAIITKLPNIINTVLNNVTTDVKLSEITGYLPYIQSMDSEGVSFNIIPGEASYEGGKWYFIADEAAIPGFMEEVFSDTPEETEEAVVIDKSVSITILNSTGVAGAAGVARDTLEAADYEVREIGNYTVKAYDITTIMAKDVTLARQFLTYFPDAQIIEDSNITTEIQIILGNDIQ